MRLHRIDRLFHSVVVLGAAIGAGCGSSVDVGTSDSTGGGGASGSGGAGGSGGDSSSSTGGQVIDDPTDCPTKTQFFCDDIIGGKVCHCEPTAPAGPESCEHTQDFHCNQYTPDFVGCNCRPNSPLIPADCGDVQYFYCAVEAPPIGCDCLVPIK